MSGFLISWVNPSEVRRASGKTLASKNKLCSLRACLRQQAHNLSLARVWYYRRTLSERVRYEFLAPAPYRAAKQVQPQNKL